MEFGSFHAGMKDQSKENANPGFPRCASEKSYCDQKNWQIYKNSFYKLGLSLWSRHSNAPKHTEHAYKNDLQASAPNCQ